MSGETLLLGIDVGTTNIKAIAFDRCGQVVAGSSVATPTHYPQPGWAYYDPEELWQSSADAVRKTVSQLTDPKQIASVAVASIGETGVLIDAQGLPLGQAIAWFDARTAAQAEWIDEHIGRDRLFAVTGMSLQPIFSLCKLLWLRDHAAASFRRAVNWLNTADYIAFRLSGEGATDYSLASRTCAMDIRRLQWDKQLLADAGIALDLLAPLAPSGTRLGQVRREAAQITGLPESAVVAVGGHDHVCGALAAGVNQPGSLLFSMGTAEGIFLPVTAPLADPNFGRQGYNQGAHTVGGYYAFGAHYTSGACIDWFRESCAVGVDYGTLVAEAEETPAGSLGVTFLPHLRYANAPYVDGKARGAFVGLTTDVKRGALFRAILEGIALETRISLEPLLAHIGIRRVETVRATGGSTRNRLLMQIKANVQNQAIHVMRIDEATTLGAAILGGIGAGIYASVDDALSQIRHVETIVEPDAAEATFYAALYQEVYERMYLSLRDLNHRIHDLQQTPHHDP